MNEPAALPVVLVVEDEAMILYDVRSAFEDAGFRALTAMAGPEALRLIDQNSASIRALVTDIDLGPGPTGWELAHAARERNPGLPIVYTTSCARVYWAINGVPDSVFMSKPFAATQVVAAVSGLLNAGGPPASA